MQLRLYLRRRYAEVQFDPRRLASSRINDVDRAVLEADREAHAAAGAHYQPGLHGWTNHFPAADATAAQPISSHVPLNDALGEVQPLSRGGRAVLRCRPGASMS
ncbi:hypothetical protein [Aestuariimicrobium sp. Y1814]|uniref:hypothetical protein n=1 Tax=Aestuariimicrobium sp. Y1814 TaxID=3418742 RepID=UPI003DA70A95